MTHATLSGALTLCCVALAALTPAAGAGTSLAATAEPGWQHLKGLDHGHGHALAAVGWANGRAWFVIGSNKALIVGSARPNRLRLTAQRTVRVPVPLGWYPIVLGSDILHSSSPTLSGVSPLIADGAVGPTVAPSPEPMASGVGIPVAATRIGGRIVWVLAGGVPVGEGINFRPSLWVCCDTTGTPRDLSALATLRITAPPRAHAIDIDDQGRIWLAWVDGRLARAEIRMVQLDPTTLAPLTPAALVAPVPNLREPTLNTDRVSLVCTSTCRVVTGSGFPLRSGGFGARIVTWAPGERTPTRVALPRKANEYQQAYLITAASRGGRLAIAYRQDTIDGPRTLKIAVADAHGRNARLAGSIAMQELSLGRPWYTFAAGAFTPAGFVYAQSYSNNGLRGHILATVVPIR